ncbi:hypothetical protein Goklo_025077 [Gossypium klotzschianum]|uniref:Uncharacterized protein n=1 Tax=Gossypium klotzschianum TaxID=34286 RepID=A0A7J8WE41_9ROSI|nr:hypothetical protein [Gossypium klotzschianum]
MDGNSSKSSRRGHRVESSLVAFGQDPIRCSDFDWVPLLGIWRAVGYAPLLVLKQYRSRQFIPVTQGIAEC